MNNGANCKLSRYLLSTSLDFSKTSLLYIVVQQIFWISYYHFCKLSHKSLMCQWRWSKRSQSSGKTYYTVHPKLKNLYSEQSLFVAKESISTVKKSSYLPEGFQQITSSFCKRKAFAQVKCLLLLNVKMIGILHFLIEEIG